MAKKKRSGPDLAARFAKLGEAVESAAEKALFEMGVLVKDEAARLAPVASGKLKSGYAVKMRHRGKTPVAVVGTLVKHATYVEFAKDINGHPYGKKLGDTPRVLYKALDEKTPELVEKIADAVARGLEGA